MSQTRINRNVFGVGVTSRANRKQSVRRVGNQTSTIKVRFISVWDNTHVMPVEKVNWDKHDIVTCDDRGRATIGSEYANERVFIYVAELPEMDDIADEPMDKDRQRVLNKMLIWAQDHDIETMTHLLDPINGIVTDKSGEKHRSPYSLENQGEYDA